jgi:hypothetical protein
MRVSEIAATRRRDAVSLPSNATGVAQWLFHIHPNLLPFAETFRQHGYAEVSHFANLTEGDCIALNVTLGLIPKLLKARTLAVDCVVSEWSTWSKCSKDCGQGSQMQTRVVLVSPTHGGKECPISSQQQPCNTQACPVDCQLSASWSDWSSCSKPCGGGQQTQTRTVVKAAAHGGKECPVSSQQQACNTQACPVDCQLSEPHWSDCSHTCGGGQKTLTRTVVKAAAHGGRACSDPAFFPASEVKNGLFVQYHVCNMQPCPDSRRWPF